MKGRGSVFAREIPEQDLRMSIQAYDADMVEAPGAETPRQVSRSVETRNGLTGISAESVVAR